MPLKQMAEVELGENTAENIKIKFWQDCHVTFK